MSHLRSIPTSSDERNGSHNSTQAPRPVSNVRFTLQISIPQPSSCCGLDGRSCLRLLNSILSSSSYSRRKAVEWVMLHNNRPPRLLRYKDRARYGSLPHDQPPKI